MEITTTDRPGIEQYFEPEAYLDPTDALANGNPLPEVETSGEPERAPEVEDLHARLTRDELRKLRAREAARVLFDAERRPPVEPFDLDTLAEVLSRPAPPPDRIDCLMPSEASTLIVAQRKTGKTTLTFNLARCLLTGAPFLGRFDVRPVAGTVALLNYEVSGHQAARWADEAGVPADRFILVNLRGRRNPLSHPEDAARLAAALRAHRVESLIVDPFGRAYGGKSQNDAGEVGAWLVDLDRFARVDVGALDLILTTHAGWNGERTRGASALEDWPDVIMTMTKDESENGDGARYLRAMGRDVDLDEDRLDFDPDTRRLTLAGVGNRKQASEYRQDADTRGAIVQRLERHPDGLSGKELSDLIGRKDAGFTRARDALVKARTVHQVKRAGRGGGWLYVLAPEGAEHAETYRTGTYEPTEPPLIGGEVQVRDVQDGAYRTCLDCGEPVGPGIVRCRPCFNGTTR